MSDMFVAGLDDEDDNRARRAALYNLAAHMAAPQQQDLSTEQLDQIKRIGEISHRIPETAQPSLQDGKRSSGKGDLALLAKATRPAPNASVVSHQSTLLPELNKVVSAASNANLLGTQPQRSLFTLSAEHPVQTAPIDSQAIDSLTEEAAEVLKKIQDRAQKGELSAEQMADALNVSRDEMAEHALDEAAHKLAKKEGGALHNYPNVAREMLQLGLKMETFKTTELENMKKRGDEYREKIQQLLKFSAMLDKLPSDKDSHNLKEALLDPLSNPTQPPAPGSLSKEEVEQCIKETFHSDSYTISKEQLSGGKVRTNDIMGEYKTKLTNLLTTEISVVIHNLQLLAQMMQEIGKKQHQLVSSIVSHYGGR